MMMVTLMMLKVVQKIRVVGIIGRPRSRSTSKIFKRQKLSNKVVLMNGIIVNLRFVLQARSVMNKVEERWKNEERSDL